jgi:hypothetical protein
VAPNITRQSESADAALSLNGMDGTVTLPLG